MVKWFQILGRWWWWLFLEVIPCKLNGPTATLPGTSGMFLSGDVKCSAQECCYHQSFLVPWSQCLWELKNSLRCLDDWWDDRWRLVAQVPASGPLARGHKALSGLWWGKRCFMIDSAFSDNAHTTMQPRSIDNKDTALKTFLNYRTLHSQNGVG